jgi:RNA polymerase sigma-70 factor, ECF subfamily
MDSGESNGGMQEEARAASSGPDFEQVVLPHLDAAYNLARWLVRNPDDAEDIVQEACLRAVRFFSGYQEGNARAWFLRIVRNAAYTFLEKKRPSDLTEEFDEAIHRGEPVERDAETALLRSFESRMLQEALEGLSVRFREAIILRELEGLSYKEMAEVMDIPIGTVMSSLARGRAQLRERLLGAEGREVPGGL